MWSGASAIPISDSQAICEMKVCMERRVAVIELHEVGQALGTAVALFARTLEYAEMRFQLA